MKLEDLDKVLNNCPNLTYTKQSLGDELFERVRMLSIDGIGECKIIWYTNGAYIYHNEIIIPFQAVEVSGTWPNKAKANLQFDNSYGEKCCIIPIEYYRKEED
jgi:hypothetical protein